LVRKTEEKGFTLIPLEIYFRKGNAKVLLGVARGRRLYDKREKLKKQIQDREAKRAMSKHR
jgi:SsrA-binding protein